MAEEYIKRTDVLNYPLRKGNELFDNNTAFLAGVECVMNYVADPLYVPAADVAPVVHGHWVYGCQCSVCGDRHGPYNAHHKAY